MKIHTLLFVLFFAFGISAHALKVGDPIPDLKLKNQNGKWIRLQDYKDQFVLLYFYPKDETKGCTIEATNLRDQFAEFKKSKAVVLGVSRQDEKSHQQFIEKYKLPFDLLVDEDGQFSKALGVELMPLIGLHKRQSILIGPDQKVAQIYQDVSPEKHAQEVLSAIKAKAVK